MIGLSKLSLDAKRMVHGAKCIMGYRPDMRIDFLNLDLLPGIYLVKRLKRC